MTGGGGFLGKHVCQALLARGAEVDAPGRKLVDFQDSEETYSYFDDRLQLDSFVVHLAYPGSKLGIETSIRSPFSLVSALQQMDLNIIRASVAFSVKKLLCMGSVCAYPEFTDLPTDESQLWKGYPEPVNAAYGLAKRAQLSLLQAARQEHDLNGIHLIASNMYGPGDLSGHVIPSLINRMKLAKRDGSKFVVWGEPEITRSFLYVEDAAEGVVRALERYDSGDPVNLVSGAETSMGQLTDVLRSLLDFDGEVEYDRTKPTGHRRRWFSTTRLRAALDWVPSTPLYEGLQRILEA